MVIKSTGKGFVGFLLLSPALFILTSFNSGRAADYSSLQGYWQCEEEVVRSTLEFKSHSELIFNGQAANYQLKQNILRVQEEYGVTDYYLQFIGVILTIFSPDGSVTYCQKGEKPSKPPTRQSQPQSPQTQAGLENWPPPYVRPQQVDEYNPTLQALLYKFAGRWDHVTSNTLTNIYLKPDGTYEESYEAGYSGTFEDQGGFQTGNWGATGTEQAGGNWRIEGSLRQGNIYLNGHDGSQTVLNYQVHVQNGQPYFGEYFFNGRLHSVKYIYR